MYRNLFLFGIALVLALGFPALAGAQTAEPSKAKLTVNRVGVRKWPDVDINLTLVGPDGKAIPGVNAAQFEVHEQGQPQLVQGLELGASRSVPLVLALTMDVSGSMNAGGKLGQAKMAADSFIDSLGPEDSVALLTFSDRVEEVVAPTRDRAALQAGVDALQAGGNTAIYDALYGSAQVLSKVPAGKRRAGILLTDGTDTSSKYAAPVAADVAKNADVLVYTIGLGPDPNEAALKSLSEPSGGKYFRAPSAGDLDAIYKAISIDLNSQLVVTYHSNTQVERGYELIGVQVRYKMPGIALADAVSYRPPPDAVRPSKPVGSTVTAPPPPGVVQLPPGLNPAAEARQPGTGTISASQ